MKRAPRGTLPPGVQWEQQYWITRNGISVLDNWGRTDVLLLNTGLLLPLCPEDCVVWPAHLSKRRKAIMRRLFATAGEWHVPEELADEAENADFGRGTLVPLWNLGWLDTRSAPYVNPQGIRYTRTEYRFNANALRELKDLENYKLIA